MSAPARVDNHRQTAGTFVAYDACPEHGFGMLSIYSVDEDGIGGGTRLLGPKSCCARRREVKRWRVDADDFQRLAHAFARVASPSAPSAPQEGR